MTDPRPIVRNGAGNLLARVLAGQEFSHLVTLVTIARRAQFVFAIYSNPDSRDALIDELNRRVGPLPNTRFVVTPDSPNVRAYLDGLARDLCKSRVLLHVVGLESAFPGSARWLDLQREVLAAHPHVILLWI